MKTHPAPRTLCVGIIARNAAALVHETLQSVHTLADEIVVLDTGSTDTTPEAAALGGARVVRHLWEDSFSVARNALLTHVRSSWVLWLDAGETLLPDDAALLKQFVQQYAGESQAYYLRIAAPPATGQIGGEQVARLRLHPNRPGLIFHGRVRESLARSLQAFNIDVEHLPIAVQRGPREHDPVVKAERAQRNINLADLQIAQRGPTAELLNCLGEAFQAIGDVARGMQHYRRAQELAANASTEMLEAFYGLLTCIIGPNAAQEQMQLCLAALEQFPLDAQLLCALGGYLQSTGRIELATRSFTLAAEHGQVNAQLWHLPDIREIALVCQAQLQQQTGQLEAAALTLEQGLVKYPHSARLHSARQRLLDATSSSSVPAPNLLQSPARARANASRS
jgi:glycosyltransferase involved in cell wall biosynthesis